MLLLLEKAFDRVIRAKLWEMQPQYNVSGPLLQTVKSLYRDHSACVRVEAGISPWFHIQSGIKPAMSAWLFNLYLDSCLQGVKQSDMRVKVGDLNVNCLLYAGDAVLIVYHQNPSCRHWSPL